MAIGGDRKAGERTLSLAEGLVLCLARERPTYGLVLARLLAPDGSLGQIWSVPKAMVYYAPLLPVAAALDDRLRAAEAFERALALWRYEAMTATLKFLAALAGPPADASRERPDPAGLRRSDRES